MPSAAPAVLVLWDYDGLKWPCHLGVQYRLKNALDDSWKTSRPDKIQTIIRFERDSVLEVRVAPENCVDTEPRTDVMENTLQQPIDVKLKFVTDTAEELGSVASDWSYCVRHWRDGDQASSVREIHVKSNETSCLLPQLQPGVTYLVDIYAVSEDGLKTSGPTEAAQPTTMVKDHTSYYFGQEANELPSEIKKNSPCWMLMAPCQLLSALSAVAKESVECIDKLLEQIISMNIQFSRLCILLIFVIDPFSTDFLWENHKERVIISVGMKFLVDNLIVFNYLGTLASCFMIFLRSNVDIACALLFGILCWQTVINTMLGKDIQSQNISLAIIYILVIYAENKLDRESHFILKPSQASADETRKSNLQLVGRILLLFTYVMLRRMEFSFSSVIQNVIAALLMFLVTVDYKTKLAAGVLVTWATFNSFAPWSWWVIFVRYFMVSDFNMVTDNSKVKRCLQLVGKTILLFMLYTLVRPVVSEISPFLGIFQNILGVFYMLLLVIGYKAKLPVMVLIMWLAFFLYYVNCWPAIVDDMFTVDAWAFRFFQTISIIGGLTLLASLAPSYMEERQNSFSPVTI